MINSSIEANILIDTDMDLFDYAGKLQDIFNELENVGQDMSQYKPSSIFLDKFIRRCDRHKECLVAKQALQNLKNSIGCSKESCNEYGCYLARNNNELCPILGGGE